MDRRAPVGRDPASLGFTLTENLLFAAPGQRVLLYGASWRPRAVRPVTMAEFARASGIPITGAIANPQFGGLIAGDLTLGPNSPAMRLKAGLSDPALIPH
jgi:hypothetical protein